ncbi:MAG: transcriptional regulator [Flavobacterium sp.]|nr:transcriptional regulator [Flavobacterium sp.]
MDRRVVRNNIRKLRFFQNEMSQEQLAVKAGVTRQTITAIEGSKYSPSLELAFRIALVLEVPLSDVFSYDLETGSDETTN